MHTQLINHKPAKQLEAQKENKQTNALLKLVRGFPITVFIFMNVSLTIVILLLFYT